MLEEHCMLYLLVAYSVMIFVSGHLSTRVHYCYVSIGHGHWVNHKDAHEYIIHLLCTNYIMDSERLGLGLMEI